MKKLFTLTFMMLVSCAMTFAQSKLEFVDEQGNVIPNGTVYNASGLFEDWDGLYAKDSGISIKNNTGSNADVTLDVKIVKHLEGMTYMCCPGGLCNFVSPDSPCTKTFPVSADKPESIATHCEYEDGTSGTCEMEIKISLAGEECSKINVVFVTHDLAGIEDIEATSLCNIYDITGNLIKANVDKNAVYGMNRGLYIVRELKNNNFYKIIVK